MFRSVYLKCTKSDYSIHQKVIFAIVHNESINNIPFSEVF